MRIELRVYPLRNYAQAKVVQDDKLSTWAQIKNNISTLYLQYYKQQG